MRPQVIVTLTSPRWWLKPSRAVIIDWYERQFWLGNRPILAPRPVKSFRTLAVLASVPTGLVDHDVVYEALYGDDPTGGPDANFTSLVFTQLAQYRDLQGCRVVDRLGLKVHSNRRRQFELTWRERPDDGETPAQQLPALHSSLGAQA